MQESTPSGRALVCLTVLIGGCGGGGGSSGGSNNSPAPPPATVTLSGRVTFDRVPATGGGGLDYPDTQVVPARAVTVELVEGGGAAVLGSAVTDASGNYSFTVASNADVLLRARAELIAPAWDFRVVDNTNADALYVLEGATFNTGGANLTRNLHAASGWDGAGYGNPRSAAPFAILDVAYEAARFVLESDAAAVFPALTLNWSPNNVESEDFDPDSGSIITTLYAGDLGMFILGAEDVDTDEYDRHVLAHEWGHYFEHRFARIDSIGGPHTLGDHLDMRVAFSEGFATGLSAMVTADSVYKDAHGPNQGSSFSFDVEGRLGENPGWYNEESIQELVYDLYDSNVDLSELTQPDDVALGFGPIYDVLTGHQRDAVALSSLFPFVRALKMQVPAEAAKIDSLVASQSIAQIDDDYGANRTNPADPEDDDVLPIYTDLAVNAGPVNLCSTDQFSSSVTGSQNKLGSRRYLKFTVAADTYRLTATTTEMPAGETADPDMILHRRGVIARSEDAPDPLLCTTASPSGCFETFSRTLDAGEHVLEVYEWTNTQSHDSEFPPIGRTCFDVEITQL